MASRSRGRVPSGNLRTAPVNRRGSAWNRSRLTWRCMTPHRRPAGSGAGRGAAGSAAGRGIPAAPGRVRRPRVTVAGVVRQDMDRPAAGTGALRFPGSRGAVVAPVRPPPPVASPIVPGSGAPCGSGRHRPVVDLTAGRSDRRTRPCAGRLRHSGCAARLSITFLKPSSDWVCVVAFSPVPRVMVAGSPE